jgi:glycosyltransferase involved in cell wall biosynthesis
MLPAMHFSKLSIIIPVYNEQGTISFILDKVRNVNLINNIEKEIIIVNDCSTDNTSAEIENYIYANPDLAVQYLQHKVNEGKGAALHTGIANAKGEYLIIQDADTEYDPNEYNDLLKPVLAGFADVVYGSRFAGANPHRVLFFWHTIGNKFLTFLTNLFTNLNLTLKEKRFGFEPEVTIKIARVPGIRIYEVGISYYGRTFKEGKKVDWKDGMKALYCILKYNILR